MKMIFVNIFILLFVLQFKAQEDMKLSIEERDVLIYKATEAPFKGEYTDNKTSGTYLCKRCNAPLYKSTDKFDSGCGWPSFDDEIPDAVTKLKDKDGRRTEIVCNNCQAHLGHVFYGEGFTAKDTRHCVNSISMQFVPEKDTIDTPVLERAIFAAGCFWSPDYYFHNKKGVVHTLVGYIGGTKEYPTYEEVCYTNTGHAEAVEVLFNPKIVSYEELLTLFFEIHDPTQKDRQGPDVGTQYRSEIFYCNEKQKQIAENIIALLKSKGKNIQTNLSKASIFWPAEKYHQNYYMSRGQRPFCR